MVYQDGRGSEPMMEVGSVTLADALYILGEPQERKRYPEENSQMQIEDQAESCRCHDTRAARSVGERGPATACSLAAHAHLTPRQQSQRPSGPRVFLQAGGRQDHLKEQLAQHALLIQVQLAVPHARMQD